MRESPRNNSDQQSMGLLAQFAFTKLESQWRIRGKMKSMEHGAFQILEDSRNISKLRGPCCNHELTDIVDCIENV